MNIGEVVNFSLPHGFKRDHVTKVEIMKIDEVHILGGVALLYTCRRTDNGTLILAWACDLSEETR